MTNIAMGNDPFMVYLNDPKYAFHSPTKFVVGCF